MDRTSGALIRLLIALVLLCGSMHVCAMQVDDTPPSAPGNLVATAVSGSQINLSWTAATDNRRIWGYAITRCLGSSCTYVGFFPDILSYADTGLSSGVTYTYYVEAVDTSDNTGPGASASATTLDVVAPSAPSGLTAAPASASQINLAWPAAGDNVGVSGYLIEMCAGAGCGNFSQVAGTGATSYSVTGLAGATTYSFRVRAYDAVPNYGGYSPVASATTLDSVAPSAPTALTANAASGVQIDLSWPASTDNVGVAGYAIERCQGSGCTNFSQIATAATNSYGNTGLTSVTTYRYRVRAYDAVPNYGSYSPIASATTLDSIAPSAPAALTANAASGVQIDLSWLASTDNVGVVGYAIERCQGSGCTNFSQIATAATNSYSNTGLTPVTTYRYRVRAYDAGPNYGSYSPIAFATTLDTIAPSAPGTLSAAPASSSQINLSWSAATDNIGVTGHLVERCQGSGCTSYVQIASLTGTAYGDTGLAAATTYRYRVRATDAQSNYGGYTNEVQATTLTGQPADTQAPTTPTGLTVTAGTNQLNLSWSASTDNIGVTAYLIERCAGTSCSYTEVASVTTTSYVDTNVAIATNYSYRVRARDAADNRSAYSTVGTAMPAACD